MANILKISCLIIATIIGAGFSSGREIYTFFNRYHNNEIIMFLSTFIVFYICIFYTLKLSYNKKIENYSKMLNNIFGENKKKIIEKVFEIFLLIIFSIMIAGFGEFLEQIIGLKSIYGSIILLIICFITLLNNIEGIIKVSVIIVPIIILAIISLFFIELNSNKLYIYEKIIESNYFSGIIYASYNLVIAIPVIISSSTLIKKNKDIKYISFISSGIIILLILVLYSILNNYIFQVKNISMPLLYISKLHSKMMYILYIVVIAFSIYTTAISIQYSLVQKYIKNRYIFAIIISGLISLIISFMSFNKLIDIFFPIIGIIGIGQIILIIFYYKTYKNN